MQLERAEEKLYRLASAEIVRLLLPLLGTDFVALARVQRTYMHEPPPSVKSGPLLDLRSSFIVYTVQCAPSEPSTVHTMA